MALRWREKHLGTFAKIERRLLASHPEMRIVILLESPERESVVSAFRAGASGVFCRAEPIETLWTCIEIVHRGKIWANDEELKFVLEELASSASLPLPQRRPAYALSEREHNIVQLVAEGLTNRQIAAELGLNEHTLKSSLEHLFHKLGVSSRAEMVFAASGHTLAQPTDPIVLEQRGDGLSDDRARFDSYARAAEHSLPFAQLAVGEMLLEGRGTDRDLLAAYVWFLVAEDSATEVVKRSRAYRDALAATMTKEQLAEAERRVSQLRKQQTGERLGSLEEPRRSQRGDAVEKNRSVYAKPALIA